MPKPRLSLRFWTSAALIGVAVLLSWFLMPSDQRARISVANHDEPTYSSEPLLPLPPVPALDASRVALGERLFFDVRLSRDNSISCASCHAFPRGGADRQRFSRGVAGAMGNVNAPTVFNASLNLAQFWDGRAATLEEQAAGPVHNPIEMASGWPEVLAKLGRDAELVRAFGKAYPDGLTEKNIVDAIATYERSLLTPNASFDRFLRGEEAALGEQERKGYRLFKDYGCASCHQGANVGGNMFQRFGILADYFANRVVRESDLGRYNVTKRAEDRHVFKVPSLRNVAVTAPYFHDGSAATLDEAVMVMGRYQLGRDLPPGDVRALVAFLKSLTGQWQGQMLQ